MFSKIRFLKLNFLLLLSLISLYSLVKIKSEACRASNDPFSERQVEESTQGFFSSSETSNSSTNNFESTTSEILILEETLRIEDDLFDNINLDLGRFDKSRQFKIFENVYVGEKFVELSKTLDVTLASQASLDRLHWIIEVAKFWTGPISIAVFVPDVEFELAKILLKKLIECIPEIQDQVAFHFVFPVAHPPKGILIDKPLQALQGNYNCSNIKTVTTEILKSENMKNPKFLNWRISYLYPQSHMRNVARKASQTDYVFLTDIDIIPSKNCAEDLSKFLAKKTCSNCAYVIPVYEILENSKYPETKEDLKNLVRSKKARPFHQTAFRNAQFATNTSMYERIQNDSEVHVSHEAIYEFYYEPFYVANDIVPEHDERFLGYGYTRNTQAYETWESGWSFQVLSPVFGIHHGFQERKFRPAWREVQNNNNKKKLDRFKEEMRVKYKTVPKANHRKV